MLEEENEVVVINQTAIVFGSFDPIVLHEGTQRLERHIPTSPKLEVQFGSISLVDLPSPAPSLQPSTNGGNDGNVIESASLNDEG